MILVLKIMFVWCLHWGVGRMCLEWWSTGVKLSDFVMSHPRDLLRPLCLTCGVTHL